jgi:hypothetical protein
LYAPALGQPFQPQPIGGPGDSGSLIVVDEPGTRDHRKPVGLLFAGGPRGVVDATIANPIGPVLQRFNLEVDDGSGRPSAGGISGTMGGAVGQIPPLP